jgi:aspartate--ammonia ligase
MYKLIVPPGYRSKLDVVQTEKAIKDLRLHFENGLAGALNLVRVSAPLFVYPETGLNDNLNGVEQPVGFGIREQNGRKAEIVHSLAKWKRYALKKYGFVYGEGIYTNMNAIRPEEETDNIHSIYVDQWDWERVIDRSERCIPALEETVRAIYAAIRATEAYISGSYPQITRCLPEDIVFVQSQDLEDEYPNLTPKEREYMVAKKYGAVFIIGIGGALKSGGIHDGRAADYDDWMLNGDIFVYYGEMDIAVELSSMGIRVDEQSLKRQLEIRGQQDKLDLPYHKAVLNGDLPLTIGGGIGQSRLCMVLLKKAHIGEVQASLWPREVEMQCEENGIHLL